ncbi:hypothetical protein [Staphylococcus aureus]|uniref:hypothetical protein n=1 Tax=Staphylococcus aureus TaxID=1280 RepID=UPI00044676EA|nr:hypothetical protein [Staphylococcus aureus]EZY77522.1 hypothetical protein V066_02563 [Staphylococcus aureus R0615]MCR0867157.1 hypothetical protein [Staphylococcus aureus]UFA54899.1 hypothetical protein LB315_07180 [Staphylococcus aureus]HCX3192706.1 hypothetical protein [Staphylococcus aureus]HDD0308537.1 hypothetical protein [Staphylococcus aureus]
METYGWTLTEVKAQPYIQLLEILSSESEAEKQDKEQQKVYTGSDLKMLFGG